MAPYHTISGQYMFRIMYSTPSSRRMFESFEDMLEALALNFLAPSSPVSTVDPALITPTDAKSFHQDALGGRGILISTCGIYPSGCHDFGASIKAQYESLDYSQKQGCCYSPGCSEPKASFTPMPSKKDYKIMFLTGCMLDTSKGLITLLEQGLGIKGFESIYIVVPPHLSGDWNLNYRTKFARLQSQFSNTPYKINLITTGIRCDLTHSIGQPKPLALLSSSSIYKTSENCLGMIYISRPNLNSEAGAWYLSLFFSKISLLTRSQKIGKPSILFVGDKSTNFKEIEKFATAYGVEMIASARLPQADFLKSIQQVCERGGLVALDGVQTLRQVLYLKGRMLAFNPEVNNNTNYYREMVENVPPELKEIANLVLGQSNGEMDGVCALDSHTLSMISNEELLTKLFNVLHLNEVRPCEKFDADLKECKQSLLKGSLGSASVVGGAGVAAAGARVAAGAGVAAPAVLVAGAGVAGSFPKPSLPASALRFFSTQGKEKSINEKISQMIRKLTNLTSAEFKVVAEYNPDNCSYIVNVSAAKLEDTNKLDQEIGDALNWVNENNELGETVTKNSEGHWQISVSVDNVLDLLEARRFDDVEPLSEEQSGSLRKQREERSTLAF